MRIITLIENTAGREDLAAEHGLSLYIETDQHKILFDAGESNAFAENAERLGVDLRDVNIAILSHGHYDHSGGLQRFMEINQNAPVYMSRYAFSPCYHGNDYYIGIDQSLIGNSRIRFADDVCTIAEGLTLFSCNEKERSYPTNSFGLTVLENGLYKDDLFLHEQYLLIEEDGKRVLISGCSHKGILNIAKWFTPDVLVGGFHFMNLDPEAESARELYLAAETLSQYPTNYYTGHCTGSAQFEFMKTIMGNKLHAISGGSQIVI